MSPDAIIFDFDGVIADSEMVSCALFSRALTGMGLPTSPEEAHERYLGRNRADSLASIHAQWGALVPADIAERIEAETHVHFLAPIPPVAGLDAFLARSAHLPRGIASSNASAFIRHHLDAFALAHHFGDHIYSGREHVTRGKPFPDLYLHAAAALGVAPARCVVIEDSPIGARAALAAGARVFGLAAGSHARPSLTAALRAEGVEGVFDSYAELSAHLRLHQ
ncbi:HAD family hydrolase [Sphingobium nicotianae]|uniref:HAD family phosphatase n=1 Tax=Sphingobium nicotianae TaxID=2782607 RepID=A0A9X1DAD9_9SPHN|nr:HAD family phosphatase [Sphingobium nicotianae]MBT2186377.1 HAD family phosphatase [Sphingobium nicotianae]